MRRRASLVLLALAVCCTALSPLLRLYAVPRLVAVPADTYQAVVMEAEDATLVDYATLRARRVPRLVMVQSLRGDVPAARRIKAATGRDVVVWDTLVHAATSDGTLVSRIPERYVFDARTQQPVHAGGEHVDGTPVTRDGIEYKWPFFTEKRDYRYFDLMTRTSAPIHYKGTRTFHGLTVYRFEQTIPWTPVPLPRQLPLGVTPETVTAMGLERWYSTTRTFLVEPVTGAPVDGEELHREEMRWTGQPEKDPVPAFSGHVRMRADYVRHTVAQVAGQRRLILLLRSWLPWGLPPLGAALLAAALILEARDRRAFRDPGAHDGGKPERVTPAQGARGATATQGGPP
ncbi:hypothetical protein GCM10010218_55090 [Streptomyces mashuensis]|uniref:DUF3068 domain-containing protein n=1 Tax=Streptomyces mashuensis TaxID=33904 RepID=A0A919EEQ7_9ACTN|nr:DUF3068 domain-containing protein [Streptomyces mashuensis]GHF66502.1 hypothetical protein GCM10010218_55090 [Streptomyces mashuensis]